MLFKKKKKKKLNQLHPHNQNSQLNICQKPTYRINSDRVIFYVIS